MKGRPVDGGVIPLTHLGGPLLAVAGGDDLLWGSEGATRAMMTELMNDRHPHQVLTYVSAGHGVGVVPYTASAPVGQPAHRRARLPGRQPRRRRRREGTGLAELLSFLAGLAH